MSIECRLHDFYVTNSKDTTDQDESNSSDSSASTKRKPKQNADIYKIQMFGMDEKGQKYSVLIKDFHPHFYVKVPDSWKSRDLANFISHLKSKLKKFDRNTLIEDLCKFKLRGDFAGFSNERKFKFVKLVFSNMAGFYNINRLWYRDQILKANGYRYNNENLRIYESNIAPLLRCFHITGVSPSGWIRLPKRKYRTIENNTTCDFSFEISHKDIVSLPDKETIVPFEQVSMDIEADSSHDDFPLPCKTYHKSATNIIDILDRPENKKNTYNDWEAKLHDVVLAMFDYKDMGNVVYRAYPKQMPSLAELNVMINMWITTPITVLKEGMSESALYAQSIECAFKKKEQMAIAEAKANEERAAKALAAANAALNGFSANNNTGSNADGDDTDDDNDSIPEDGGGDVDAADVDCNNDLADNVTIIDILMDDAIDRTKKLTIINDTMCSAFPPLEGDKCTFIGSSLMRYGESEPHLNWCGVLGTCTKPTKSDVNLQIVTFPTERALLLGWRDFIVKHRPDFMYGFNTTGFDFEFMYRRSVELDCTEEFLKLSRINDHVCGVWSSAEHCYKLTEKVIPLASGDHILHYPEIPGCPQIDMLNQTRKRQTNLESYKLDDVASFYMADSISSIIWDERANVSKCYTKNITGLYDDFYIKAQIVGNSKNYYTNPVTNSQKIRVSKVYRNVDGKNWFEVPGDIMLPTFVDRDNNAVKINKIDAPKKQKSDDLTPQFTRFYTTTPHTLITGESVDISVIGNSKVKKSVTIAAVDNNGQWFDVEGKTSPLEKTVSWCFVKDDVNHLDIFRMTKGSDDDRLAIAKYCINDCNLPLQIANKTMILTAFIEDAKLCWVPVSFVALRGQSIKLASFMALMARGSNKLIPVLPKGEETDAFDGATVLDPAIDIYVDHPIPVLDFASLYPSSECSENISHDTKVLCKSYDLSGNLMPDSVYGECDENGKFIYDNLPGHTYVDIEFPIYRKVRKSAAAGAVWVKKCIGYRITRFAQLPHGKKGIMPKVLTELLAMRKSVRALIPLQTDPFLANTYDQRQLSIKGLANSLYGGTGCITSIFYDLDIAAATTAIGRKMLLNAKNIVEECYGDGTEVTLKNGEKYLTYAKNVYGDTDSLFINPNVTNLDGSQVDRARILEIVIEVAQQISALISGFLKPPHDFEYEKTYYPFLIFRKKGYTGIKYTFDVNDGHRAEMGVANVRRNYVQIVKEIVSGMFDIILSEKDIIKSMDYLIGYIQDIIDGKIPLEHLVLTKSLNSFYKKPKSVPHKVLADRITARDPGNQPKSGDRLSYAFIINKNKKALQGERIETLDFIRNNNLKIDYGYYIKKQLQKPTQQIIALGLEHILHTKNPAKLAALKADSDKIYKMYKIIPKQTEYDDGTDDQIDNDPENAEIECIKERRRKCKRDITKLRNKIVNEYVFDKFIIDVNNQANNQKSIINSFSSGGSATKSATVSTASGPKISKKAAAMLKIKCVKPG